MQEQFLQQHKGGFQGNMAVARVPKFAVVQLPGWSINLLFKKSVEKNY